MVGTRPYLAYAVGIDSRILENLQRWDWLKCIMHYLKGTLSCEILYKLGYFASEASKELKNHSAQVHLSGLSRL